MNIRLTIIAVLLSVFLLSCTEKQVPSVIKINTEKCNFDRNKAKLVIVWLIYGNYNNSPNPKKVCKFDRTIYPPIPEIISVEGTGANVPFTYDNRLAVGFYDLPDKKLLYSNWIPIEKSGGEVGTRGIMYILSFLFPHPKNVFLINLDLVKNGSKGFENDLFVGTVVEQ